MSVFCFVFHWGEFDCVCLCVYFVFSCILFLLLGIGWVQMIDWSPRWVLMCRHETVCFRGGIQSLPLGGAEPMSSPPPLPTTPPPIPPLPPSFPPVPSLSFPSLLHFPFPSLTSFPSPWRGGSGGPPPENFEILDCCRWVLAHSGMQKGVCKCVCF